MTRENDERDANHVREHLDELREKISSREIPFEDELFPASSRSLFINGHSPLQQHSSIIPTVSPPPSAIQWLRPEHIRPIRSKDNRKQTWTVFRQPSPNDVIQGALGLPFSLHSTI